MSFRSLLIILAVGVVLTACNTVHKNIGQNDPFFGEAVKYNTAIQTINPDPVYPPGAAQHGDHGEKGAEAVKRYRTDKVKDVEMMGTTSSPTSGTSSPPR